MVMLKLVWSAVEHCQFRVRSVDSSALGEFSLLSLGITMY